MSKPKFKSFSTKLPTLAEWSKNFRQRQTTVPRATLTNPSIAGKSIFRLNLENASKMTAVEINPGLGIWTTTLKDNGFKRVIALEPVPAYNNWMTGLSEQSAGIVEVLKKDGYDWETYINLKEPQYLGGLENKDWTQVHPDIFFTGTLPKGSRGEQLLAQFMTCIANRMALFTMGRIQMALWVPDNLFYKITAPPDTLARCKMSIIAEACADVKPICSTGPKDTYPRGEYHLVHIVPFAESRIKSQWDVFEYVLKHLFVMQKKPLSHMVK
ncbi:ribosomal RNA adenine methyltransferase KsgA/Erm [Parasitella parasitica]|nr:ribosomal RNA adenine methyltransferase KsgA/Erm [Parasitella parasitica]